ncbi:MAG: hypothetical protein J3Q66DRAFT_407783 [Benniella sp.]|nr:MAG: hypothetical protein J3Q66DRAFT_407783 [Benniella sp.]
MASNQWRLIIEEMAQASSRPRKDGHAPATWLICNHRYPHEGSAGVLPGPLLLQENGPSSDFRLWLITALGGSNHFRARLSRGTAFYDVYCTATQPENSWAVSCWTKHTGSTAIRAENPVLDDLDIQESDIQSQGDPPRKGDAGTSDGPDFHCCAATVGDSGGNVTDYQRHRLEELRSRSINSALPVGLFKRVALGNWNFPLFDQLKFRIATSFRICDGSTAEEG